MVVCESYNTNSFLVVTAGIDMSEVPPTVVSEFESVKLSENIQCSPGDCMENSLGANCISSDGSTPATKSPTLISWWLKTKACVSKLCIALLK